MDGPSRATVDNRVEHALLWCDAILSSAVRVVFDSAWRTTVLHMVQGKQELKDARESDARRR
eukprot:m.863352 g.863352  ORF g.863352 m.863352 type:complete len:62 (+) comp59701_c0_seq2:1340-1525(+)